MEGALTGASSRRCMHGAMQPTPPFSYEPHALTAALTRCELGFYLV